MPMKNLTIATRLRLGMGVILVLVMSLGIGAWIQAGRLADQTTDLYEHPLTVRSAIGAIQADVEQIATHTRDMLMAQGEQGRTASLEGIRIAEADADRQLAILVDRYLGPPEDVARLRDEFVRWSSIREETIRLIEDGKIPEATLRVLPDGVLTVEANAVRTELLVVDRFARAKAEQFYQAASELRNAVNIQLAVILAIILFISLYVAWRLIKAVRDPLLELTAAADQFRRGNLDARSTYSVADEFGALSVSFNAMADAIQVESQVNEGTAQVSAAMLREEEAHAFFRVMLAALLQHTGSQVGAVYLLDETKTVFEHFESIGMGEGGRATFSATDAEGELGLALATRQIQHISDIPPDTRFAFAAASGDFAPREILTIPVPAGHRVSAVVSLASIRAYDARSIRLVDDLWSVLIARVNGVLAFHQTRALAEDLDLQNRELEAQQSELTAQASELAAQNVELGMQAEQLGEASRLKSVFLSKMSHELRTPLNSVIALSGVLGRRLADRIPGEEVGYLEVIERNGRNLLALINDILDLSRVEAGKEEFSVARFSLRTLAGEVVDMIEPEARAKHIALDNLVDSDLPTLVSDPDKVMHILQNLVGNAVKFTETGSVTITAQRDGDEVRVTVHDTGIGIAADQLPHIFDEFRQADESSSRRFGGTGLGLAIAQKYASMLKGGIEVHSTPGGGSTFTLRLPLVLDLPDLTPSEDATTRPMDGTTGALSTLPGRGQRILLVEDSEPAVVQMTDILVEQGYRLQVARDGQEALEQIEQIVPDAMILDLMMPGVDGFQVLEAIRGIERTAHLPVLILTARHVTREELSFLKGNHVHQLIQKGDVSRAKLLAAVARMVAPAVEEPAPTPEARERPPRTGRPVVLVVEDNIDNLRTLKALLDDRYQVVEATDGVAGVHQARLHRPDVILMDIAMPVMDGVAALGEIRRDEALRHIPVIAVTASAMKGDRETILAHGFDGYLSKPIDADLLERTVRGAFD